MRRFSVSVIIRLAHFFDMKSNQISPNKDGSVAHVDTSQIA